MSAAKPAAAAALACLLAACAAGPAEIPLVDRELGGTRWTGVVDGAMPEGQLPRLEFRSDGMLVGYTGCNTLRGSYRVEGDRLEIVAVTTKRGCTGLAAEVEQRLLEVITTNPRLRIGANTLVITGAKGQRFEFSEVR